MLRLGWEGVSDGICGIELVSFIVNEKGSGRGSSKNYKFWLAAHFAVILWVASLCYLSV